MRASWPSTNRSATELQVDSGPIPAFACQENAPSPATTAISTASKSAKGRSVRTGCRMDGEVGRSARLGYEMPHAIKVGTMLEVPAMVWQLPALLPTVDFLSVGSNDLIQFFFAVDRSSPRVADRYDRLSPAALSILRSIVLHSDAFGVPVSLCGEMAGSPLEAMALIGIGFRSISMRPACGAVDVEATEAS